MPQIRQMFFQQADIDAQELVHGQKGSVRKGFDHREQIDLLAAFAQALCHLERHHSSHRISDENVGTHRLLLPDGIKKIFRHVLDSFMRLVHSINAPGLQPVDRAIRLNMM